MPNLTEEDVKNLYITPALDRCWNKFAYEYRMEVYFTDGRINVQGNTNSRQPGKKADYLLYMNTDNPIAVVEAKDQTHTASFGMQQAIEYAKMLDVPFAYASNGQEFVEHDFFTGLERTIPMDQFPSKDELIRRYKAEVNGGAGLNANEQKVLDQPCYTNVNTYPPRYYQRIAINRTLNAIAKGQNRSLLAMATGTGKTYTAFQIVYRLLKSGMKKKILYLADRNILVDQSIQQDFAPLRNVIEKIKVAGADPAAITSHQVYFSLYQQLIGDNGEKHYERLFRNDFFDLVIVDEVHHIVADNGQKIFDYFHPSFMLGLTATPERMDNKDIFGLFDQNIPFELRLRDAILNDLVVPFHYYGIRTVLADYHERDRMKVSKEIARQENVAFITGEIEKHRIKNEKLKCLAFCTSIAHCQLVAEEFRRMNYKAVALTGENDLGQRIKAFNDLQDNSNPLEIIEEAA